MKTTLMTRRGAVVLILGAVLALGGVGCGSGSPKVGSVAGVVLDDLGAPVVGVRIIIGALFDTTNALGQFTVAGVSSGAHSVAAAKDGYTFTSQAVMVPRGGTVNTTLTGSRDNAAPTVEITASPSTVSFVGGTSTLTVTVTDADNDPLTPTLTGPDGNVALDQVSAGVFRATVPLVANNSVVAMTYNYQASANDGRVTTRATATVTVNGLNTPGDVGGGSTPGGGGPDIPDIR